MPRYAEVIRQWHTLRDLDSSRHGISINELAVVRDVTTRTIRRDLAALEEAGFSLYNERGDDGTVRWKLNGAPFKTLTDAGFSLSELCALYFSRTLIACMAGTPFREDLERAFEKFARLLTPRMRQFLDRLPSVLTAKAEPIKRRDGRRSRDMIAHLIEATASHRRATIRYHSLSSRRTRDYIVEPHRLVYAQGGLYLTAYVPDYREPRTFAIERLERVTILEETFEAPNADERDPFPHSLGVNQGIPERVELVFDAQVAPYIAERRWHASQKLHLRPDGSAEMTLDVCDDPPLRSWILSFGPLVRVVSPPRLSQTVLQELERARANYVPSIEAEPGDSAMVEREIQPTLPFPG
jgi:predicted DNA-binding transcriptional regulator YafY